MSINHSFVLIKAPFLRIKVPAPFQDFQGAHLWWELRPSPIKAKGNEQALLRCELVCVVEVVFFHYLGHLDAFAFEHEAYLVACVCYHNQLQSDTRNGPWQCCKHFCAMLVQAHAEGVSELVEHLHTFTRFASPCFSRHFHL